MNSPLVSIITPSYNQSQFIEETILSVLNQTYKNIEYILVDGDSNDGTIDIISQYREKISLVIVEKDKGQSDAINKGFKLAKGELVGWINSDDILNPDCVEQIVKIYNKYPDGVIYYSSNIDIIDENSQKIGLINTRIRTREYLLRKNYDVVQPGSFYKRTIVDKIRYIDDKYNFCMDLDLWLRLLKHGSIHSYNDSSLAKFRMWGMSKTTNGGKLFLQEIRKTLLENGAKMYNSSIIKTYWYELKINILKLVRK